MEEWVGDQTLECTQQGRDEYGRVVAICTVSGVDLSERLARNGLAITLPHFTDRYLTAQQYAHQHGIGIWAGTFDTPSAYRAAHPRQYRPAPPRPRPATPARTAATPSRPDLYFRSCREARAAGYAMMRRGEPGYRVGLDGDLDGIACEPPPHRR
nr:thermonuclease family protein [Novosphingobium sp. 9]